MEYIFCPEPNKFEVLKRPGFAFEFSHNSVIGLRVQRMGLCQEGGFTVLTVRVRDIIKAPLVLIGLSD